VNELLSSDKVVFDPQHFFVSHFQSYFSFDSIIQFVLHLSQLISKLQTWFFSLSHFRHLNGCQLDTITRPSVVITDSFNSLYNQPSRRHRDEQLMSMYFFSHFSMCKVWAKFVFLIYHFSLLAIGGVSLLFAISSVSLYYFCVSCFFLAPYEW